MSFITTQGIVLRLVPYGEKEAILDLFTKDHGRAQLFIKKEGRSTASFPSPFCTVEVVYRCGKSKNQLARSHEIAPINWQMGLRSELCRVEAAAAIVKALQQVASFDLPAPLLYALLERSLSAIGKGVEAAAVTACFYLKLLRHEGLWQNIGEQCSLCLSKLAEKGYLAGGETFCAGHAPSYAFIFTVQEAALFNALAAVPSFSALKELAVSKLFAAKAYSLFSHLI